MYTITVKSTSLHRSSIDSRPDCFPNTNHTTVAHQYDCSVDSQRLMSCSARLAVVSSVFCSCLARNLPRRDTTFVGSKQPSLARHIAIADRCRLVKTSSFDRNFAQASNRKLAPTAPRSVCIVASVFVSAITARCRLVKTSLFDRNFAQTLTEKLAPSTARRSVSSHVSSLVYWNETLHCVLVSCLPQNRIFLRQWQQSDDSDVV